MKFGEFYTAVCCELKEHHGWKGPISYLAMKPHLLTLMYEQYVMNTRVFIPLTDDEAKECWNKCVESTTLKIAQEG